MARDRLGSRNSLAASASFITIVPRLAAPPSVASMICVLRLQEIALELLQIGEQPFFGVHGPALLVGNSPKDEALADDLLPLLHFDGAEPRQFRPPDIFVAGARRVAEAITEAQVLPDEDDRIAAQMLGQVIRQMGDRRAAGQFGFAQLHFAKQALGKRVAEQRDRPGIHRQNRAVRLRLGDQLGP